MSTEPLNLGGFVFYLFDDDRSGCLDFAEIKRILEIIHAQDLNKPGHLQDKIRLELQNKPPNLNLDEFQKWTRAKPMLTNPVLNMQLKMQECVAGQKFWKKACRERSGDADKAMPGYIFGEIARAEAIYSLLEKKRIASKTIDELKGDVKKKCAASRPVDEKSRRRNSLMLGLMNMKEIKRPVRNTAAAKFDIEKFRDKNDTKIDDGPKKSRKDKCGASAVSMNVIMAEDEAVFVDSLDAQKNSEAKAKPDSPSKKKGRSTIAVLSKESSDKNSEKSDKSSGKTQRSHRATIVGKVGEQQARSHRSTVVSPKNGISEGREKVKNGRSTIMSTPSGTGVGNLPPLKVKSKKNMSQ